MKGNIYKLTMIQIYSHLAENFTFINILHLYGASQVLSVKQLEHNMQVKHKALRTKVYILEMLD